MKDLNVLAIIDELTLIEGRMVGLGYATMLAAGEDTPAGGVCRLASDVLIHDAEAIRGILDAYDEAQLISSNEAIAESDS